MKRSGYAMSTKHSSWLDSRLMFFQDLGALCALLRFKTCVVLSDFPASLYGGGCKRKRWCGQAWRAKQLSLEQTFGHCASFAPMQLSDVGLAVQYFLASLCGQPG